MCRFLICKMHIHCSPAPISTPPIRHSIQRSFDRTFLDGTVEIITVVAGPGSTLPSMHVGSLLHCVISLSQCQRFVCFHSLILMVSDLFAYEYLMSIVKKRMKEKRRVRDSVVIFCFRSNVRAFWFVWHLKMVWRGRKCLFPRGKMMSGNGTNEEQWR